MRKLLVELAEDLQRKFAKFGLKQPKSKVVEGIIVDDQFGAQAVEAVKELGLKVYVPRATFQGETLPEKGIWVIDASTDLPVGAIVNIEVFFTSAQRGMAQDVRLIVPKEEDPEEEARKKEEEEAMERYREGLRDPAKYVLPPPNRMQKLFGAPQEEDTSIPVSYGRMLAKLLPNDPILWARFLMQKSKAGAANGGVAYTLPSDQKAADGMQ